MTAMFIAFGSQATDLVPQATPVPDSNAQDNLFARDLIRGETHLIDVSLDGSSTGNASCRNVSLSETGRFIAFESSATKLDDLSGEGDRYPRIFRYDLETRRVELVSVPGAERSTAGEMPTTSADGHLIAFLSACPPLADQNVCGSTVWLRDMETKVSTAVIPDRDGDCCQEVAWTTPRLSPDGRFLVFGATGATFIRDLEKRRTFPVVRSPVTGKVAGIPDFSGVNFEGDLFAFSWWARALMRSAKPYESDICTVRFSELDRTEIYFPGIPSKSGLTTGLAFTSVSDEQGEVKLTLRDVQGELRSGPQIQNPSGQIFEPRSQLARLDHEIFGSGTQAAGSGWVEAEGRGFPVTGFSMFYDSELPDARRNGSDGPFQ